MSIEIATRLTAFGSMFTTSRLRRESVDALPMRSNVFSSIRTFAITGVLRTLSVVVAFVGMLAALMALQLERTREIGVLRALGLTPRQVWGLITAQTGIIGLIAGLLAVPSGLMLAAVLVFVINRRSFGWTMSIDPSPSILLQGVALSVLGVLWYRAAFLQSYLFAYMFWLGIALGSVAPTVVRATRTEAALAEGASVEAAQQTLLDEIVPIDDIRSTAEYRRRVAANLLANLLRQSR